MLKMVLLGHAKSGRTQFFKNINGHLIYIQEKRATLGADFCELEYEHGNIRVKISLFDINSNLRYESIYPQLVRASQAIIIFYDAGSREQFQSVEYWIAISRSKQIEQPYGFIICNTAYVSEKGRVIEEEEGHKLAASWGFTYLQCSFRESEDIKNIFEHIIILTANNFLQ